MQRVNSGKLKIKKWQVNRKENAFYHKVHKEGTKDTEKYEKYEKC